MVIEGKKSRLNNTGLVVDRISELPDSILGHILSSLATDSAVATSILSKRWRFAWVTVNSLDFSNRGDENEEEYMQFTRFVDRVLLLNDAGSMNKFSLDCGLVNLPPQIDSWIYTAIRKNVKELYLSVRDMSMPTRIFTCESLRSLEVRGSPHIFLPGAVCLPSLESLKIHHVCFQYATACEKLINGCPILHYLNLDILNPQLYDDHFDEDADYEDPICIISSASLRRLEVNFTYTSRLQLKAPSLEYFRLGGCISGFFVEKGLSSLVQADLNLKISLDEDDIRNNSFVEAIQAFDCVKFLTLSTDVMRALGRATITLSTEFKRLVKFVAGSYTCSVQDFIQNSENLEDVIIYQDSKKRGPNSRWIAPMEVPRCLSKSLKKVQLHGYKGARDENEMIRYMLEHGSGLEVMQIHCSWYLDYEEKDQLIEWIREFPRKSRVCDVQFPTGQVNVHHW